jgi:hypothetical protein
LIFTNRLTFNFTQYDFIAERKLCFSSRVVKHGEKGKPQPAIWFDRSVFITSTVLESFPEAFLPPMALWTVSLGSYEPQSFH